MKLKYTLLLTLSVFLLSGNAQGFKLLTYKWPTETYNYFINATNADVTKAKAQAALISGSDAWKRYCPGVFQGNVTQRKISYNNKNTVFFRKGKYAPAPNAIAICYTTFTGDGKTILDFDIVFYDGWKFSTGTTGCSNGFYIEDIATHEFGHAIGLDHSLVRAATMFASTPPCNTALRSLSRDDKRGANRKY